MQITACGKVCGCMHTCVRKCVFVRVEREGVSVGQTDGAGEVTVG